MRKETRLVTRINGGKKEGKMEFGIAFDLPISPKIVKPISVRSITDAIVELVTNGDDSYNRPHE